MLRLADGTAELYDLRDGSSREFRSGASGHAEKSAYADDCSNSPGIHVRCSLSERDPGMRLRSALRDLQLEVSRHRSDRSRPERKGDPRVRTSFRAEQSASRHTDAVLSHANGTMRNGCFVAEPLAALSNLGVANSAFVLTPFYRKEALIHRDAPTAQSVRYPALPSGWGLASSGAFLFSMLLPPDSPPLHEQHPVDVIHAHGPLLSRTFAAITLASAS